MRAWAPLSCGWKRTRLRSYKAAATLETEKRSGGKGGVEPSERGVGRWVSNEGSAAAAAANRQAANHQAAAVGAAQYRQAANHQAAAAAAAETNKQTNKQTNKTKQTQKIPKIQTNKQTNKQTNSSKAATKKQRSSSHVWNEKQSGGRGELNPQRGGSIP